MSVAGKFLIYNALLFSTSIFIDCKVRVVTRLLAREPGNGSSVLCTVDTFLFSAVFQPILGPPSAIKEVKEVNFPKVERVSLRADRFLV
jgi:hypothetical protein